MELYPKAKFANYTPPPRTLSRSYGEYQQWIQAILNNNPAGTEMPFSYSGPLCETLALGNVAYRVGTKLEWDPVQLKATTLLRQIGSFKAVTVQGGSWINPIFQQDLQQKEPGSASDTADQFCRLAALLRHD